MHFSEILQGIAARGILFGAGHIFIIVSTLYLGLLAYKRNPRNLNNKNFMLLNVCFAAWSATMYISDLVFLPVTHETMNFLGRLTWGSGFILGFAYYNFCFTFPNDTRAKPWYFYLAMMITFAFGGIAVFTGLVEKDFFPSKTNPLEFVIYKGQLFSYAFMVYALLGFGGSWILFSKLKNLKGKEKTQVQYVFFGVFTFTVYIFTTDLIPNLFSFSDMSRYGAFGLIPFVASTSYAMFKHRLMDIRLVVLKSAVYTSLIGLMAIGYIFFVFYLKKYYEQVINTDLVFIAATFLAAFGFQPLKRFLQQYADKIFSKGRYNFEELLKKISQVLSNSFVLDNLVDQLLLTLSTEMQIS